MPAGRPLLLLALASAVVVLGVACAPAGSEPIEDEEDTGAAAVANFEEGDEEEEYEEDEAEKAGEVFGLTGGQEPIDL